MSEVADRPETGGGFCRKCGVVLDDHIGWLKLKVPHCPGRKSA